MKHKLCIFLYMILILVIYSNQKSTIAVFEFIRHGARQPKFLLELTNNLLYGTGEMNLTPNGYRQHYILGRLSKKNLYKKLLEEDEIKVNVVSSPIQRCIFSVTAQLQGMFSFPKIKYENLNKNLNIKDNDLPPGYTQLVEDFSAARFKEKLKIKKKSKKPMSLDNETFIEKVINVKIVDYLTDGLFHPDKCNYIVKGDSLENSFIQLNLAKK